VATSKLVHVSDRPNGDGKTTAIRLLLDLIRPTRGQPEVFGTVPRAARCEAGAQVAFPGTDTWPRARASAARCSIRLPGADQACTQLSGFSSRICDAAQKHSPEPVPMPASRTCARLSLGLLR
jgi:hypothetical protein